MPYLDWLSKHWKYNLISGGILILVASALALKGYDMAGHSAAGAAIIAWGLGASEVPKEAKRQYWYKALGMMGVAVLIAVLFALMGKQ